MKYNKGFTGVAVLLVVLGVLIVGGVAYFAGKSSAPKSEVSELNDDSNYSPVEKQENNSPVLNTNTTVQNSLPVDNVSSTVSTICNSNSPISLKLLSPNGGETYAVGQQITVKWESCNLPVQDIFVYLHKDGSSYDDAIALSVFTPNDGSEVFTIPAVSSGDYKIRVGHASARVPQDFSDGSFRIN
jgi:hypothetical protein